jgi:hypothetical protein
MAYVGLCSLGAKLVDLTALIAGVFMASIFGYWVLASLGTDAVVLKGGANRIGLSIKRMPLSVLLDHGFFSLGHYFLPQAFRP